MPKIFNPAQNINSIMGPVQRPATAGGSPGPSFGSPGSRTPPPVPMQLVAPGSRPPPPAPAKGVTPKPRAPSFSPPPQTGGPSRPFEMAAGAKKGGKVGSASKRADGIAQKGKTRGTIVMCGGGMYKK